MSEIMSHVEPRVQRRQVRSAVRQARAMLAEQRVARRELREMYRGGTTAELRAAKAVRDIARKECRDARTLVRAAALSRIGRRIDLTAMLAASHADYSPVWTVVDPCCAKPYGNTYVCGTWAGATDEPLGAVTRYGVLVSHCVAIPAKRDTNSTFRPSGLPPLPPFARRLVRDKTIRRRATWVGVLYQPQAWEAVTPKVDPAVVVEWKDRPGEYYALAVWGGDRARIMEFVD